MDAGESKSKAKVKVKCLVNFYKRSIAYSHGLTTDVNRDIPWQDESREQIKDSPSNAKAFKRLRPRSQANTKDTHFGLNDQKGQALASLAHRRTVEDYCILCMFVFISFSLSFITTRNCKNHFEVKKGRGSLKFGRHLSVLI